MNDSFGAHRAKINGALSGIASRTGAPAVLQGALQRALTSSGKRVRGILLLAAGEAAGAKIDKLVDAAVAMEMIHACSLILDDLPAMDDAQMRRGAPTLHREFGEDLAILTAVSLLNQAYGLVVRNHLDLSPRQWPMAVVLQRVVNAVGWDGAIAGQAIDLHNEGSTLDFSTLEVIHSRKTGALFVASAGVGAMLANASPNVVQRVEIFAKNLGLAFQITDDVLDAVGTPEVLGKDVGKDEERLTFVKLAGVDGARKLADELVETSLDSIASLGPASRSLRNLALTVRDRVK